MNNSSAVFAAIIDYSILCRAPFQLWFQWFVVGVTVEIVFTRSISTISIRNYYVNLVYSLMYLAVIFIVSSSICNLVALLRDLVGIHGLTKLRNIEDSSLISQFKIFAVYFFVVDFFQYWWHRAQHKYPVLWDQHVVHHSDESMNVTTATRHHWSEFPVPSFSGRAPGFDFHST